MYESSCKNQTHMAIVLNISWLQARINKIQSKITVLTYLNNFTQTSLRLPLELTSFYNIVRLYRVTLTKINIVPTHIRTIHKHTAALQFYTQCFLETVSLNNRTFFVTMSVMVNEKRILILSRFAMVSPRPRAEDNGTVEWSTEKENKDIV